MSAKKAIIAIRAGNRASAQLARQRTRAGFRYTNSIDDAIYGNLTGNISGNTAKMTAEQTRLTSSLQRLKANQVRGARRVSQGAKTDVQQAYGSAIAGGNALNLQGVQVAGRAGNKVVGAQAAAGGILARGNEAAASTLASGVQLAQAGAQGQVADALAYRARDDAALAAQNDLTLKTMVLQNKLDLENYKKKLAMQSAAEGGGMEAVGAMAASATSGLFDGFRKYIDGQGGTYSPDKVQVQEDGSVLALNPESGDFEIPVQAPSAGAVANNYLVANGIDPLSNQGQAITSIARAMGAAGAGAQPGKYHPVGAGNAIVNAVNQQMSIMYPQFAKHQDTIDGVIRASLAGVGPISVSGGTVNNGQVNIDDDLSWFDELKYRVVHPFKAAAHYLSPAYYLQGEPLTDDREAAHVSTVAAAISLLALGGGAPLTKSLALPAARLAGLPAAVGVSAEAAAAAVTKLTKAQRAMKILRVILTGRSSAPLAVPVVADAGITAEMVAAARAGGTGSAAYKDLLARVNGMIP